MDTTDLTDRIYATDAIRPRSRIDADDPGDADDPSSPIDNDPIDGADPNSPIDDVDLSVPANPSSPIEAADPHADVINHADIDDIVVSDTADPISPIDDVAAGRSSPTDAVDPLVHIDDVAPIDGADPVSPIDTEDLSDVADPTSPIDAGDPRNTIHDAGAISAADPHSPINDVEIDAADPHSPINDDEIDAAEPHSPINDDEIVTADPNSPIDHVNPGGAADPSTTIDNEVINAADPNAPIDDVDPSSTIDAADPSDAPDPIDANGSTDMHSNNPHIIIECDDRSTKDAIVTGGEVSKPHDVISCIPITDEWTIHSVVGEIDPTDLVNVVINQSDAPDLTNSTDTHSHRNTPSIISEWRRSPRQEGSKCDVDSLKEVSCDDKRRRDRNPRSESDNERQRRKSKEEPKDKDVSKKDGDKGRSVRERSPRRDNANNKRKRSPSKEENKDKDVLNKDGDKERSVRDRSPSKEDGNNKRKRSLSKEESEHKDSKKASVDDKGRSGRDRSPRKYNVSNKRERSPSKGGSKDRDASKKDSHYDKGRSGRDRSPKKDTVWIRRDRSTSKGSFKDKDVTKKDSDKRQSGRDWGPRKEKTEISKQNVQEVDTGRCGMCAKCMSSDCGICHCCEAIIMIRQQGKMVFPLQCVKSRCSKLRPIRPNEWQRKLLDILMKVKKTDLKIKISSEDGTCILTQQSKDKVSLLPNSEGQKEVPTKNVTSSDKMETSVEQHNVDDKAIVGNPIDWKIAIALYASELESGKLNDQTKKVKLVKEGKNRQLVHRYISEESRWDVTSQARKKKKKIVKDTAIPGGSTGTSQVPHLDISKLQCGRCKNCNITRCGKCHYCQVNLKLQQGGNLLFPMQCIKNPCFIDITHHSSSELKCRERQMMLMRAVLRKYKPPPDEGELMTKSTSSDTATPVVTYATGVKTKSIEPVSHFWMCMKCGMKNNNLRSQCSRCNVTKPPIPFKAVPDNKVSVTSTNHNSAPELVVPDLSNEISITPTNIIMLRNLNTLTPDDVIHEFIQDVYPFVIKDIYITRIQRADTTTRTCYVELHNLKFATMMYNLLTKKQLILDGHQVLVSYGKEPEVITPPEITTPLNTPMKVELQINKKTRQESSTSGAVKCQYCGMEKSEDHNCRVGYDTIELPPEVIIPDPEEVSITPTNYILLRNLDLNTTEIAIHDAIQSVSPIPVLGIHILRNPVTNVSTGMCYVEAQNIVIAIMMYDILTNNQLVIEGQQVLVSYGKIPEVPVPEINNPSNIAPESIQQKTIQIPQKDQQDMHTSTSHQITDDSDEIRDTLEDVFINEKADKFKSDTSSKPDQSVLQHEVHPEYPGCKKCKKSHLCDKHATVQKYTRSAEEEKNLDIHPDYPDCKKCRKSHLCDYHERKRYRRRKEQEKVPGHPDHPDCSKCSKSRLCDYHEEEKHRRRKEDKKTVTEDLEDALKSAASIIQEKATSSRTNSHSDRSSVPKLDVHPEYPDCRKCKKSQLCDLHAAEKKYSTKMEIMEKKDKNISSSYFSWNTEVETVEGRCPSDAELSFWKTHRRIASSKFTSTDWLDVDWSKTMSCFLLHPQSVSFNPPVVPEDLEPMIPTDFQLTPEHSTSLKAWGTMAHGLLATRSALFSAVQQLQVLSSRHPELESELPEILDYLRPADKTIVDTIQVSASQFNSLAFHERNSLLQTLEDETLKKQLECIPPSPTMLFDLNNAEQYLLSTKNEPSVETL